MKFSKFGWVASAAMLGLIVGSGFQAKPEKLGYVDMQGVYDGSNYKNANDEKVQALILARKTALDFLASYPTFTADQLTRYKVLAIKAELLPAEKTELTKLQNDVKAATAQYDQLRQKQNPSTAEVATLNDLGNRNSLSTQAHAAWERDFQTDVDAQRQSLSSDVDAKIRDAVQQVAKQGGYTLVFNEHAAAYGAADLGPDVKKAVDKGVK